MFRRGEAARTTKASEPDLDPGAPTLTSLAPNYEFVDHGVYFTILHETLLSRPTVRNIALAGTYGTGKSSILREVARTFGDRVAEVSLLSLGSVPAEHADETASPAETKTNRIQKEIVKQLLYQQRPHRAPASRFRRIVRFRWREELVAGSVAALVAVLLAWAAGLNVETTPGLAITISGRPNWVPYVALLGVVALLAASVVFVARSIARGRIGIERVSAGPATISLPPRSTSYFDEYLDEIIYFFETNPRLDIVIIEDLDRFDDPRIFESLRSLNGLLNAAEQVEKRSIRFIYAMRDSVFENLGRDVSAENTDEARAEVVRANRTKFFDLVVPVVPFITHRNARDLMQTQLAARGHAISKDLIDLAGRHLADMRLIHNILNEYEVFRHRLLDVPQPVPGLDEDRLFAMVIFKNAHMGEFERIRLGSSSLDVLWDTWRLFVKHQLDEIQTATTRLRKRIRLAEAAQEYATKLGTAMRARVDILAQDALANGEIRLDGSLITDQTLHSISFWQQVASGQQITLSARQIGTYTPRPASLSRKQVETLLGMPVDAAHFVEDSLDTDRTSITVYETQPAFLRRHTWQQFAATDYQYARESAAEPQTFADLVRDLLPSKLAADLVIHGYITSYFALHVSTFYGQLIRPDAMIYVLKCVERGEPDPEYPLAAEDVESILRDQGKSVLAERSVLNVDIMNHLLQTRREDADTVVGTAVRSGSEGREFIELYLTRGAEKSEFVELLTPRMGDVFTYLAETDAVSETERFNLIDVAVHAREPAMTYETGPRLVELLNASYASLPSLRPHDETARAAAMVSYLDSAGAVVSDVSVLSSVARDALVATTAYALTMTNLEALLGSSLVSLDDISQRSSSMLDYILANVERYLEIYAEQPRTYPTATTSHLLVRALNAKSDWTRRELDLLLTGSAPTCLIEDLSDAPPAAWPAAFGARRVKVTAANVLSYLDTYGVVDDDLGAALSAVGEVIDGEDETDANRMRLAVSIINAKSAQLPPARRIDLAAAVAPGPIPLANVEPSTGDLVGRLLSAQLIPDAAEVFASRLMVDWETQRSAIMASAQYVTLLSPATLQSKFLTPLLKDEDMSNLHSLLGPTLASYPNVPPEAYEAAAHRALQRSFDLDASLLDLFRSGGVADATVIRLLADFADRLTDDDVRATLRAMGAPWADVADPGWGVHVLPEEPGLEAVLLRLQAAGVVSKLPLAGGTRRVSLKRQ